MFRVAALARSAVATARFATSSIGMRVAVAHIGLGLGVRVDEDV